MPENFEKNNIVEKLDNIKSPEEEKDYDKVFDEIVEIAGYLRTTGSDKFKNNDIIAEFGHNILKNFSSEKACKYYLWHPLGGSNLSPENRDKSYAQLKAEGIMDEFDFPGEYSIEEFLRKMHEKEKEKNAE